MTDDERAALTTRLTDLQRKLAAREGRNGGGYAANIEALKAEIASLEGLLA